MHGETLKFVKKPLTFLFVEYFAENGRIRPKHVAVLPQVCISLYLIIVRLLV